MSQTKVQLINAKQTFDTSGVDNVGVITASSFSGDGSQLVGVGVGTTASVNTTGIITAVSFSGDGSGLTGVGFGTEDSGSTTGIITASKFSGSGIGLTNIGGPVAGLVYSPAIGATSISVETNIEIIFSKPIQAGVGTITLRENAADGTIVESIDITSDAITIDTARLTINPTSPLGAGTTHFVVIPTGTVKDTYAGISSNVGITSYSFLTTGADDYGDVPGELYGWGSGANGPLGQNNEVQYSSPVQIPGTSWRSIHNNYNTTLATKTDGTLWVWGHNAYGALGQNDRTNTSSPVQVPGTQWKNMVGGGYMSANAIKTDGTLWMWGRNNEGQLGLDNKTEYSSPVQVPGTQWDRIYQRGYYGSSCFASKTDGTLWVWGSNYAGNLGLNNKVDYSSPVQLPGTQWDCDLRKISVDSCAAALKTDGTLWMWGQDTDGQLGQETTGVDLSSPTQVPGTQWATVNVSEPVMATKTDGTAWVWGDNEFGALGQNSRTEYSSPRVLPGTQWKYIAAAHTNSMGQKTDGTLWIWGRNNAGQLGQNQSATVVTGYSSPVQIPGTQWQTPHGEVYQIFSIVKS